MSLKRKKEKKKKKKNYGKITEISASLAFLTLAMEQR
jgi:hypothetical protein